MRGRKVRDDQSTNFLNVDLDIYSIERLDRLVEAFGDDAFVLWTGREGSRYAAHLELAGMTGGQASADRTINKFVAMIEALPPDARRLWRSATRREFNIGIQAESTPAAFKLPLKPATVAAITSVKGTLLVTVYAPKLKSR